MSPGCRTAAAVLVGLVPVLPVLLLLLVLVLLSIGAELCAADGRAHSTTAAVNQGRTKNTLTSHHPESRGVPTIAPNGRSVQSPHRESDTVRRLGMAWARPWFVGAAVSAAQCGRDARTHITDGRTHIYPPFVDTTGLRLRDRIGEPFDQTATEPRILSHPWPASLRVGDDVLGGFP